MERPAIELSKGRDGWKAESSIRLPGVVEKPGIGSNDEPGQAYLSISTYKNTTRGGLNTFVRVDYRSGMWRRTGIFQNYGGRLLSSTDRCTEKTVTALHAKALDLLPQVLTACAAHYGVADVLAAPQMVAA